MRVLARIDSRRHRGLRGPPACPVAIDGALAVFPVFRHRGFDAVALIGCVEAATLGTARLVVG
jgi:hypothetical protein